MCNCLVHASPGKKRHAEIILGFGISRAYFQCFLVMSNPIVELALLRKKPAQIVMRLEIPRPQLNSPPIMSHCLIGLPSVIESDAQIVMCHPATGILYQCRSVQADKIVVDVSLSPCRKKQQQ